MYNIFLTDEQTTVLLAAALLIGIALVLYLLKNKTMSSPYSTPMLDRFSRDLTELARRGILDPIVGRRNEIDKLTRILSRRTKNNVILVGEAGVGKTAIVEGLAQNIAAKITPSDLFNKRILSLDLNALIAGTKYRGEFEERIKRITEEISHSQRTIILFIDEIHNLIEPESSGESISAGDILKPAMARGELQVVGATTQQEFDQYFQKDPAFRRRLQPIFVAEPNDEETLEVLRGIKPRYEKYHNVEITDEALVTCVRLGKRILPDRSFPDKAIDVMDESASKVKLDNLKLSKVKDVKTTPKVLPEDVRKIVAEYEVSGKKKKLKVIVKNGNN